MKSIAVILTGAGYLDGAEINESVFLLTEFSAAEVNYDIYSVDKDFYATAHYSGTHKDLGSRNCLEETARITRGKVRPLEELSVNRYDGVALPGGYGVAKNLSTWAQDGAGCTVNKDFKELILKFHKDSKPILALCIAPALIARVLGQVCSPTLTIGNDEETIKQIERTGADHEVCEVTDFVTDRENKLITTPAYMYEAPLHHVQKGVAGAAKEFLEMC